MQRTVRWHDLNAHNEMDMATLLGYIDDCGRRVVAAHNWPVERMLAHGFGILLRRNEIEYKEPARLDDELLITTYASSVKRATATRHYLVERLPDGKILARINALGVWVNLDSGQPIRVPPEFIRDFEPNISA